MGLIIVATQQRLCFHFFIFFFCITIITQTLIQAHNILPTLTSNIAATIQTQLFAGLILQADTFHITYF